MTANKWYCIAQTTTFDTSCGITIYSEGVAVSFTTSVRFGSSSINIASCVIDGQTLLSIRLRETDNKWCVDILCNTDLNPIINVTDSTYWEAQNTPAGTGSIIAIINDISKEFNTGIKGGESLWEIINVGTEETPVWALKPKKIKDVAPGVISESFLTFGGIKSDENEEGGGGITTFDVFVGNDGPYPLQEGRVNLPAYPVVPTDYASVGWVEDNFTPIDAHNTLSQRVTALENSGTGGGSGGTTSVVSYNASVLSGKLLGTLTINGIDNKIYAPTIPTKLSAFTNDEGYVTEDWVNGKGFLTAHQSLTHLLSKTEAANTYQPKGDYATKTALDGATLRISVLENTLSTEQGYIDTLQGYFTDGKAKKAIADSDGNNIINTYATKSSLSATDTNLSNLTKAFNEFKALVDSMWYLDPDHANTVRTKLNVVVEQAISFGGYGESSGSGGGLTSFKVKVGSTTYTSVGDTVSLPAYPTIPTKISAFTNDANYAYKSDIPSLIGYAKLTDIPSLDGYAKLTDIPSVDKYLTTNTPQTIEKAGAKIFKGAYGENIYIGGTKSGISIDINAANGGFARAISFINSADSFNDYVQFGVYGDTSVGFKSAFISVGEQQDYNNAILNIYTDRIDVAGKASFSKLTTHSEGLKIGTISVTEKTKNNTEYIEIDGNLVVTGAISFGGFGEGGSTGGGITTVTKDMVINALGYTPYSATNPNNYVSSSVLGSLAYKSSLSFSELTDKPTTISGYGIKDAYTKDEANGRFFGLDVAGIDANCADGITNLNKAGYGYATGGWRGSGPALAFGSSNGYTALIQQGTSSYSLYVSYKSNGGDIQEWRTLAFLDSNVLNAQNLRHSNGTLGATVSGAGNVGIGTTEPSYKLDVRGAIHTSERLNVYKWIKDANNKDVLQGGIVTSFDEKDCAYMMFSSANSNSITYGKDLGILNSTGGDIRIMRFDRHSKIESTSIWMRKDGVTIGSSYPYGYRVLLTTGYIESAGLNFAITSKEETETAMTGVTFDWKKDTDTLELSRVYYDETNENKYSKNDFNLKINGNLVTTGSITFGSASDRRLKDNIKSMTDKQAIAVLSALNPVTFNWNSTAYELGKLSGVSDGFIADEYEKLIPNSGRDIWANYRAINYERATGYLVKGWQNHETRLEKAERRIKELENELKQYRRA